MLTSVIRVLCWLLATSSMAWALLDPYFRDSEGMLSGKFCLPLSLSAAFLILAWAAAGRWWRPASWFALALVGQAAALQLVDAGNQIHYQHFRPVGQLLAGTHPLVIALLGVQAVAVLLGLRIRARTLCKWVGRSFRFWQIVTFGLLFALTSATVSARVPDYFAEVIFATCIQAVNLATIVLAAWSLPEDGLPIVRSRLRQWFGDRDAKRSSVHLLDRFGVLAAVWVFSISTWLSFSIYEWHPHVPDEVSYLIQARYFAEGTISMPAPPVPAAFDLDLMTYEEQRWYSPFPPGWPLVLAIGVLLGVPWLVNPLLAGVNVVLSYVFLRENYDLPVARMTILLLCLSPWHIFMAMNLMSHTFALTCALAVMLGVSRARQRNQARWGWLAGAALGVLSLIRPLEAIAVGATASLWLIVAGRRRLAIGSLAGLVLAAALVGSTVLPYNKALTGDSTLFPVMAYFDQHYGPNSNALGFGPDRGVGWAIDPFPGHGPLDALVNANLNTTSINTELFGWSTGSLFLIALLILSFAARGTDYMMIALMAAIFCVHVFYYFSGGPDFGARYWYLMLVPCAVLTVTGMHHLQRILERDAHASPFAGTRIKVAVLALSLMAMVNFMPWRSLDKYRNYRGMRPDIRQLAERNRFGRSLVLIRGEQRPDYASAAIYNPLDLSSDDPIYAWDRNPEVRAKTIAAYSDRPVWYVNGPSITKAGFVIADK